MKVTRKMLILNWVYIAVVVVLGFVGVVIYVAINGYSNIQNTTETFHDFYLEKNKSQIQQEVVSQLEAIRYEESIITQNEYKNIRSEVNRLEAVLTALEMDVDASLEERQRQAVLSFERMIESDSKHLYFILNSGGSLLVSGTSDELVGTNIYDSKDSDGVYYTREILEAMNQKDGLYVTYKWPKEEGGIPESKTSFCKYIEDLDIIIGTGVYNSEITSYLKDNVIERLNNYYAEETNYIFIAKNDGTALVHGDPTLVHADMKAFLNAEGESLHPMLKAGSQVEGGSFVTYTYRRSGTDYYVEKISFVIQVDGWDAYMGMGFYTEDLDDLVDSHNKTFQERYVRHITLLVVLLVIISLIVFQILKRGNQLQATYMKQEELVYTELFNQIIEGIVVLNNNKVLYSNEIARSYFSGDIEAYVYSGSLHFDRSNGDVSIVENDKGQVHYLEVSEKQIQYKGIAATIHFLKNVSTTYRKADAYQKISMVDVLTGLPNRRALQNDFMPDNLSQDCEMVIGLIDLDHFKRVNDTFGHNRGDEVIKELGSVFNKRLRSHDTFYRYGGEEFVVVMKDITIEDAKRLLEQINKKMQQTCEEKFGIAQSFSGGIVRVDCSEAVAISSYISKADDLLYKAKNSGRNRIEY